MRLAWLAGSGVALLLALAALPAGAEQYNVVASAGNDGDAHVDNDDPAAQASFSRTDVGSELYEAGANADGGSVYASAFHVDPLPFAAITTGAGASIEETIHFEELPTTSVTISAQIGAAVTATRVVGFANASASINLDECSASIGHNAVTGPSQSSNCPGDGSGSVVLVLTRDELIARNAEVDIEVHVSATLEASGGLNASASATGALPLLLRRGAAPEPGRAYLTIDPPLEVTFTGSATHFDPIPAPEPGAPLLVAVGAGVLAMCRRRAATSSSAGS
jgi:hypothetical protein